MCFFFILDVSYLKHRDTNTPSVRSPCSRGLLPARNAPARLPSYLVVYGQTQQRNDKTQREILIVGCVISVSLCLIICACCIFVDFLMLAVIFCHLVFCDFLDLSLCSINCAAVSCSLLCCPVCCCIMWYVVVVFFLAVIIFCYLLCSEFVRKCCRTTPGQQGALCQWEGCHFLRLLSSYILNVYLETCLLFFHPF